MKNFILTLILICPFSFLIQAQKTIEDGNAELRNVAGFQAIEVSTGIKLILTQGNEQVAVSASKPEYRDKIITKIENGVLILKYESKTGAVNRKRENKDLRAYVSFKSLDMLTINTGAIVEFNDELRINSLDLRANTGGIMNGNININTLKVSQNTGSRIDVTGHVSNLVIKGDTGSKFEGEELKTSVCDISVSTGAKVTVTSEKEISVKANTGAIVKYKGDPPVRKIKVSTGGYVTKI